MSSNTVNRRRHERFTLSPMYSRVSLRFLDSDSFEFEGHGWDICEGGICFELDRAIENWVYDMSGGEPE